MMDMRLKMRKTVAQFFDLEGVRLAAEDLQLLYDYVSDLSTFTLREMHTTQMSAAREGNQLVDRTTWNTYRFASDGHVEHLYYFKDSKGRQGNRVEKLTKVRDVLDVLNLIGGEGVRLVRTTRMVAPLRSTAPAGGEKEKASAVLEIKRIRQQLKLSQSEMAELMGVSQSQVSAWETGRSRVSVNSMKRLTQILEEQKKLHR